MSIKKILGWGIDDIKINHKGIVTDSRLNPESLAFKTYHDPAYSDEAYLKRLQKIIGDGEEMEIFDRFFGKEAVNKYDEEELNNIQMLALSGFQFYHMHRDRLLPGSDSRHVTHQILDGIVFNRENNGRNVLMIAPFTESDSWVRCDDALDFYSVGDFSSNISDLKIIPDGIYPYDNRYMDARTGRQLDSQKCILLKRAGVRMECADKKVNPELLQQGIDLLSNSLGFVNYKEAQENIVPIVPVEVRDVAQWLEIFSDDISYLNLRPMVYTYLM